MAAMYRVRFTTRPPGRVRSEDVRSADFPCELDDLPALLPARPYVLSVENLAEGREVHWTRWPDAFRPGARPAAGGPVIT